MKDQLSIKQFLKYIVSASFCIKAGTPETEMFLPVFMVLPQAIGVPSVFCSLILWLLFLEGGIACHCPKAACSVSCFVPLVLGL